MKSSDLRKEKQQEAIGAGVRGAGKSVVREEVREGGELTNHAGLCRSLEKL